VPASRRPGEREPRAELQAWYLASLYPKLARAVGGGTVTPAAARELDRQLRDLLDLRGDASREAA
jgi:hypothetical protein